MSLFDRLFEYAESPALEPSRHKSFKSLSNKYEPKPSGGPLSPHRLTSRETSKVSARPVAMVKGTVAGALASKKISQRFSEALALVDGVLDEAKKKGFISQEISHLMHGKASKGPLKGKAVPQKQAVAIALNVARRKGLKVPSKHGKN
jgi:hypothetical protein